MGTLVSIQAYRERRENEEVMSLLLAAQQLAARTDEDARHGLEALTERLYEVTHGGPEEPPPAVFRQRVPSVPAWGRVLQFPTPIAKAA